MGLLTQTTTLTLGMLVVCLLPLIYGKMERWSALIFLFGTGALFGICAFDLLPDVVALGGPTSLTITVVVGTVYSIIHLFHLRHHESESAHGEHVEHHHPHFRVFYLSIVSHCFASGVLLSASRNLSEKLAGAVFLALLAHKGYECIIFVSILLQQHYSRLRNFVIVGTYCLALPVGVGLTYCFQAQITQTIAVYISSVAVGSLLGCLIFDFVIPSYHQVRRQWLHVAWVLFGLILTRLFMGHA